MPDIVTDKIKIRQGLEGYLPPGPFWDAWREENSQVSKLVMDPLVNSHARVRSRAVDLLNEVLPHKTAEMLASREEEAGLPDGCSGPAETFHQRRDQVVSKWRAEPGLHPAYLKKRARDVGFNISIIEPQPLMSGWSSVGCGYCGSQGYQFFVIVHDIQTYHWQVGCSSVGEPMCVLPDLSVLTCLIDREKPAHMTAIYKVEEN